jgi:alanine dehydrogenase
MAPSAPVLFLSRDEVTALFDLDDYMEAVEGAFRSYAEGLTLTPALLHVDGLGGEFHVKAGGLTVGGRTYFGLKANGGFFGNPARDLPAIQGVIYLADASTGQPLAILDSIHITAQRTAATTAVAAKYLARPESHTALICGAGRQGRVQLAALMSVLRLDRIFVWSRDGARADRYAVEMGQARGVQITTVTDPSEGALESDIIVTCTPSKTPLIRRDAVKPGTFIAAVGADSPDKRELDVEILRIAGVICDVTAQCAHVGELHHAIEAGVLTEDDVRAELGEVIAGKGEGRRNDHEIIVFDSTGTALQDVASAAAIYERAMSASRGTRVFLS